MTADNTASEKPVRLTDLDKSFLRLVQRSNRDADGWCNCSKVTYPYFSSTVRADLAEFEQVGDAGRCRLTQLGQSLLDAMDYL
jgi:hypothetical protein